MPQSFTEKYPSTYTIIDASEIFIETPTDLQVQSCTWSNYKHHNTNTMIAGHHNNTILFTILIFPLER